MHISINDTVSSKVLKSKNKDTQTTQGSHHSYEPKPFIPGGGNGDGGIEGSRLPQRQHLDPLASIARVSPNRPNPNPTNRTHWLLWTQAASTIVGFWVLLYFLIMLYFCYLCSWWAISLPGLVLFSSCYTVLGLTLAIAVWGIDFFSFCCSLLLRKAAWVYLVLPSTWLLRATAATWVHKSHWCRYPGSQSLSCCGHSDEACLDERE